MKDILLKTAWIVWHSILLITIFFGNTSGLGFERYDKFKKGFDEFEAKERSKHSQ